MLQTGVRQSQNNNSDLGLNIGSPSNNIDAGNFMKIEGAGVAAEGSYSVADIE